MTAVTFNAQGLEKSWLEVRELFEKYNVDFMFIQETWMKPKQRIIELRDYIISAKSEPGVRGGIALLATQSIREKTKVIHTDSHGYWGLWKIDSIYVVGCYFPPRLTCEKIRDLTEDIHLLITAQPDHETSNLMILGDFNANMAPGARTTARARELRNWMESMDLFLASDTVSERQLATGTTCNHLGVSSGNLLDLFMINNTIRMATEKFEILSSEHLESDHYPVLYQWRHSSRPIIETRTIRAPRFKVCKLEDKETRATFDSELRHATQELLSTYQLIDTEAVMQSSREFRREFITHLYKRFCEVIMEVAENTLGKINSPRPIIPAPPSMNPLNREMILAIRKRKDYRVLRDSLPPGEDRDQVHEEYLAQKRIVARETRKMKVRSYENYIIRTTEMSPIECISRLSKQAKAKTKDIDFSLDQETINMGADYFKSHFCPVNVSGTEIQKHDFQEVPDYPHAQEDLSVSGMDELQQCFDPFRILKAIERSKRAKASGSDAVIREFFHFKRTRRENGSYVHVVPLNEDPLLLMLQFIFVTSAKWMVTPAQWEEGLIVPIYKQKGAKNDWKNQRPITLLQFVRKVWETCISGLVVGTGFNILQGGFCPRKGTLEQVATLHHLCKLHKRESKNRNSSQNNRGKLYMIFLDIAGAYDTVDRPTLFQCARRRGLNERLVRILEHLYDKGNAKIIGKTFTSESFPLKAGVQQGGTVSPHLFNILIDELAKELDNMNLGPQTHDGLRVGATFFADDVALIGSKDQVQQMLTKCEEMSRTLKIQWKPSKCEWIGPPRHGNELVKFKLYGQELTRTSCFKYLGIPMNCQGINCKALVDQNISKFKSTVALLKRLGAKGQGLHQWRSIEIFKSLCLPVLEYGLSIAPLKKTHKETIEKAQLHGLRVIMGAYTCTSRHGMRRLAELEHYEDRISYLRAKWVTKAVTAGDTELITRVRNDSLNTRDSILAETIIGNEIFKAAQIETIKGHFMPEIWVLREEEEPPDIAFSDTLTRRSVLHDKRIKTYWKENVQARFDHWQEIDLAKGYGILARDLPIRTTKTRVDGILVSTISKYKSPIRNLHFTKPYERLLMGWMLGWIPSHVENNRCYVCGDFIPPSGGRKHVTDCVKRIIPDWEIEIPEGFIEPEHTENEITRLIWIAIQQDNVVSHQLPSGRVIMKWLYHVAKRVLRRDSPLEAAPGFDSSWIREE